MVLYMVVTVSILMKLLTILVYQKGTFFMHVGLTYPLRAPRHLNIILICSVCL